MPRDTLTRERIISAAIELLDTDGLEGLSMRSLGERLGSAPTAVYWHVKNKDDLVTLVSERAWGEIELPDLDGLEWREAARLMSRELFSMLVRHPWVVQALSSYLMRGPGKARYDDYGLAVFEKAGFVGVEADQALFVVFMFVLGNSIGESAAVTLRRRLRQEGSNADELIQQALNYQLKVAQDFSRLQSRIATFADTDYYAAPDQGFDLGLEVIFDGLEARLRKTSLPH
jgi:AcrR family transcriptional regulator